MHLFQFCALSVLVLLARTAPAEAGARPALSLELLPEVVLDHPRIRLADVALVRGDAARLREYSELDLGHVPRIGYAERLQRAQLETLIGQRSAAPVPQIGWTGAAAVSVRARSHTVPPTELERAALAAVHAELARRSLSGDAVLAGALAEVELPAGNWQARARELRGAPLAAHMAVWIDLLVDGAVYRSVVVPLALDVRRTVYVARRRIEPGERVTRADFDVRDENVAGVAAAFGADAELGSVRLRHAIAAGQVLTRDAVWARGAVMRGDHIRLLVNAGTIAIEAEAIALADAAPGQRVNVRPAHGGEPIAGRLNAAGAVEIE